MINITRINLYLLSTFTSLMVLIPTMTKWIENLILPSISSILKFRVSILALTAYYAALVDLAFSLGFGSPSREAYSPRVGEHLFFRWKLQLRWRFVWGGKSAGGNSGPGGGEEIQSRKFWVEKLEACRTKVDLKYEEWDLLLTQSQYIGCQIDLGLEGDWDLDWDLDWEFKEYDWIYSQIDNVQREIDQIENMVDQLDAWIEYSLEFRQLCRAVPSPTERE